MAYVSTEIKNLIKAMENNENAFISMVSRIYDENEIKSLISSIETALKHFVMDDTDDADQLTILSFTLQTINK